MPLHMSCPRMQHWTWEKLASSLSEQQAEHLRGYIPRRGILMPFKKKKGTLTLSKKDPSLTIKKSQPASPLKSFRNMGHRHMYLRSRKRHQTQRWEAWGKRWWSPCHPCREGVSAELSWFTKYSFSPQCHIAAFGLTLCGIGRVDVLTPFRFAVSESWNNLLILPKSSEWPEN